MAIFRFFYDGGRRHLGFVKFYILAVGTVEKFEVHHLAKFHQNRSNRGRNMAILDFSVLLIGRRLGRDEQLYRR